MFVCRGPARCVLFPPFFVLGLCFFFCRFFLSVFFFFVLVLGVNVFPARSFPRGPKHPLNPLSVFFGLEGGGGGGGVFFFFFDRPASTNCPGP